jgi:hypothetical protein
VSMPRRLLAALPPSTDGAASACRHTDELMPRDRAAAILVLVFGQQVEDVVGLTWDDVKVSGDLVTVRVGQIDIVLPDPEPGANWPRTRQRPDRRAPQQQLGLPGLLPRPPHRRQSPSHPTPSGVQHACHATWHTSRPHQTGPCRDPGRGARASFGSPWPRESGVQPTEGSSAGTQGSIGSWAGCGPLGSR